jgi:hypothetical protein
MRAIAVTKMYLGRMISMSVVVLILTAACMFAQKAEAIRIEFRPGSTSTQLKGTLSGNQDMEYVLRAKRGQNLSLLLTCSPVGSVKLRVHDPQNVEIPTKHLGRHRTITLPEHGDYEITVLRVTKDKGTSTYKVKVGIE